MMNSENIQVSGVAETMLQTMYARAVYSQKPGHKFYDGKAIEIAKAMNYDFSKADKDALMSSGALGGGCFFGGGHEGVVSHLPGDRENPCFAEPVQ